jgi:L-erythro-3,5-diaminohexanoate dehydrogenase
MSRLASRFGFHRVLSPLRASVQAAQRVNNTAAVLHPTESLIRVDKLVLDSTSARYLQETSRDYKMAAEKVMEIVSTRGKMHNPHTDSGGVMLGTVSEHVGNESSLTPGDRVVPLASLTCIPLELNEVFSMHGEVLNVQGTGVMFGSSPVAVVPDDIEDAVAVLSLDISSLVPQVERIMTIQQQLGTPVRSVYVQGCGKSGLAAMSTIRRMEMSGVLKSKSIILASDVHSKALTTAAISHYADVTAHIDSQDSLATLQMLSSNQFGDGVDLVLATHNQADCETSAVLAARERGNVIFFSMATVFSQANLGTDIAGKDVNCHFGVGLASQQDAAMFRLLREDQILHDHFRTLASHLRACLET